MDNAQLILLDDCPLERRCSLTSEQPNCIWQMECSIPPAGSTFKTTSVRNPAVVL